MLQTVIRIVAIGAGATLLLDLWSLGLKRLGVPVLDFALLGRWIGHMRRGRWSHRRIADAAPVAGESWIGWSAHYAVGVAFAALLVSVYGPAWALSPTFFPAFVIGVLTAAAPLFILQPAMGAGIAASKTPQPLLNSLKSVLSHAIFGIGLYLAALVAASIFR
jgi:hypothetical protein